MWNELADFFEKHQAPCLIKSLTGHECPGCGSQRALILLMRGDFWGSLHAWPALLPLLITVLFILIHFVFRFRRGGQIILFMLVFAMIVATINFFVKILG